MQFVGSLFTLALLPVVSAFENALKLAVQEEAPSDGMIPVLSFGTISSCASKSVPWVRSAHQNGSVLKNVLIDQHTSAFLAHFTSLGLTMIRTRILLHTH